MSLTVLSVAYSLAPVGPDSVGGAEQVLSILDHALTETGHHSVVVATADSQTSGTLVPTPVPASALDDAERARAQDAHRRAIELALARYPVDLVHMHGFDFHACLPPPGSPVLVTLHLPPQWYPPQVFRISRPRTFLQCVSHSQRRCCPPEATLVDTIENGIRTDILCPNGPKSDYALALGRICPEKGFHIAADASARARVPLMIAGRVFGYGTHREYFAREIVPRLNSDIRYLGPVGLQQKRELLAQARCLVAPSLANETGSLVAAEALACGTPVVAFPSGALAEIVEDGRTGFLVKDEEQMAEAIVRAATLSPDECRRTAVRRFSARRMVASYLRLYERLLRA